MTDFVKKQQELAGKGISTGKDDSSRRGDGLADFLHGRPGDTLRLSALTVVVRNGWNIRDVSETVKSDTWNISEPIPPCADVETVGWGRETSFVDLKVPGCHAVSIHKEWEGGIPLVRRTDMEAQAEVSEALIRGLKAEIARYRKALTDISENITCGCMPCMGNCWDADSLRDEISERAEIARTALKEGSGA